MSVSFKDESGTARKQIQQMGEAVCGLQFALGRTDLPSILWDCGEDLIPSHVHIFSELPKKTVTFLAAIVNTLTHLSQERGCPELFQCVSFTLFCIYNHA